METNRYIGNQHLNPYKFSRTFGFRAGTKKPNGDPDLPMIPGFYVTKWSLTMNGISVDG